MPVPRWRKRKVPKVGAPAGGAKAACICLCVHSLIIQSVTVFGEAQVKTDIRSLYLKQLFF